jgi:aminopeptidase N
MKYFITYSEVKGAIDLPITAFTDPRAYIDAVYRRGFVFLNELRKQVGESAFDAAMKDYYSKTVNRVASQDAFFDALAARSSQNIGPLVKTYFGGAVALPCKISANAIGCRR